jgi:hypothetical protein
MCGLPDAKRMTWIMRQSGGYDISIIPSKCEGKYRLEKARKKPLVSSTSGAWI